MTKDEALDACANVSRASARLEMEIRDVINRALEDDDAQIALDLTNTMMDFVISRLRHKERSCRDTTVFMKELIDRLVEVEQVDHAFMPVR